MIDSLKRYVGVLFSGGDAPGMNGFLRAFVRLGLNRHEQLVLGICDGYQGLVRVARGVVEQLARAEIGPSFPVFRTNSDKGHDLVLFDQRSVSGILGRGGIVLGSARCRSFLEPAVRRDAAAFLRDLGVFSVVVCGGEGSLSGAAYLAAESGLQVLGIPASIDNDVPHTDTCLGFDTAVNTIVDCVQKFSDTAASHHRVMVLETMGRNSGQLAQAAALAAGAEIVVTPERPALDKAKKLGIAQRLEKSMTRGRRHAIVLVAEGVSVEGGCDAGPARALASFLQGYFQHAESSLASVEVRVSVLGHVQRGGAPSSADRILAARLAEAAWNEVASARRPSGVLGVQGRSVVLHSFGRPVERNPAQSQRMYDLQKDVSKY